MKHLEHHEGAGRVKENPRDGEAWWAAVYGVAQSWTRLKRLHFDFSLSCTGDGNGNPLQCSCLENPRDGGAWWAAVYGATQSQTRLKGLSSSSSRVKHKCQLLIRRRQPDVHWNDCLLQKWLLSEKAKCVPRRNEHVCPNRHLHVNVPSNIIHNSHKAETIKCPSTEEKKMWCIYTAEYYSTKKKKEVLVSVTTWMKLENILLSERSQTQKITYCINFVCMKCPRGKPIETESRLLVSRDWVEGPPGSDCQWTGDLFMEWWKCSKLGLWWWSYSRVHVPKVTELDTFTALILW